MKKIIVTSKRKFPEMVSSHPGEDWAYISIEGTPDLVKAGLITDNNHFLPEGPNVLNLDFDDVDEDKEEKWKGEIYRVYSISDPQAIQILKFGESHKEYNLLIHCYAGRSRSVAVAQGLMDVFPWVWELSEESNPLLTPNIKVLGLIKRYGLYQGY